MIFKEGNKGEQCRRYNLRQWEKIVETEIINNIIKHGTLFHLIDTVASVNNTVSNFGCWIYNSNEKNRLLW